VNPPRLLAMTFAAVVMQSASASARPIERLNDPPRIVPWHEIGSVGIGMTPARIEYGYGAADRYGFYSVHGGHLNLWVGYYKNHVAFVATKSPYYRTLSGIGVGSTIPLGPCHHVHGTCRYTWNGFTYRRSTTRGEGNPIGDGNWTRWTKYGGYRVQVFLFVRRGVVIYVALQTDWFPPGD
jgi:hypothetical protein